jgi:hypothetical protein
VRARWTSDAEPSVHYPPGGAHRFPEIGCVRVEVAANQAAQNQQPHQNSQARKLRRNALLFFRSANGRSWPVTSCARKAGKG